MRSGKEIEIVDASRFLLSPTDTRHWPFNPRFLVCLTKPRASKFKKRRCVYPFVITDRTLNLLAFLNCKSIAEIWGSLSCTLLSEVHTTIWYFTFDTLNSINGSDHNLDQCPFRHWQLMYPAIQSSTCDKRQSHKQQESATI